MILLIVTFLVKFNSAYHSASQVFLRRMDGTESFFRPWNHYRNGFGNVAGEYWLGKIKKKTYQIKARYFHTFYTHDHIQHITVELTVQDDLTPCTVKRTEKLYFNTNNPISPVKVWQFFSIFLDQRVSVIQLVHIGGAADFH